MKYISKELFNVINSQFILSATSVHGIAHWSRVYHHAMYLGKYEKGVDLKVLELFAFLHDSQRLNDGDDRKHGQRAAEYLDKLLYADQVELTLDQYRLLSYALIHHSSGLTEADITIQCCWDADRLDLSRLGIVPDPKYLCTHTAKRNQTIQMAWQWGFFGRRRK